MSRKAWFEPQSNQEMFSQYFQRMESWQQAIADGKITSEELSQQAERVAGLLSEIEPRLDDELHEQITQLLLEIAVFNEMQRIFEAANPDR